MTAALHRALRERIARETLIEVPALTAV